MPHKTHHFQADIQIIGINPYVLIPDEILNDIFLQAGKDKGYIPITGTINKKPYKQTLVKYSGSWRLYINTTMLQNSPKRIGENIAVTIRFDLEDRSIEPHPKLLEALQKHPIASSVFEGLTRSRRHEIVRYISALKTQESIDRNIQRAINFLEGKERFVGRDKP